MKTTLSFAAAAGIALTAGSLSAQTELHTYKGDVEGDFLGLAVAGVGDVDRDGFGDFAIGIRGDDTAGAESGSMRVLSGRTGNLLFAKTGNSSYDYFGLSVAGVGDIDGDGVNDIAAGAPRDDSHVTGSDSGSVFVFSGVDGKQILHVRGDSPGEQFGRSIDAAGDVDDDGYADFVVGAPFADDFGANSGSAHVVSGRTGAFLWSFYGEAAGDEFGRSLGGVRDTNGDEIPDIAVGARLHGIPGANRIGATYLFSGADGTQLVKFVGSAAGDEFGQSVQGAGDVDGDGFGDIVVGAFLADTTSFSDAGKAYVFSGQTHAVLHTFEGPGFGSNLGRSVDSAGDIDGDGHADLIIGADRFDFATGAAYVFSGRTGAEMFRLDGEADGDLYGHSVAGAGDVDADGFTDLLIGAYREDAVGVTDAGGAHLIVSDAIGNPGRLVRFGRACAATDGRLPQIELAGVPRIGETDRLQLRAAPQGTLAYLALGLPTTTDLTVLGAPGCTLDVLPLISLQTVTDIRGRSEFSFTIPSLVELVGAELSGQWLAIDVGANALGLVTSTSLTMVVGAAIID